MAETKNKANCPLSWKCNPIELTDQEEKDLLQGKRVKVFTPFHSSYGGLILEGKTDFTCRVSTLTKEEIEEKCKNAKTFIPPGDAGNLEETEPYKL